LLETGSLPCPGPLDAPKGYQIGKEWMDALKASVSSGGSDNWYGHYQLGVMYAYNNDFKNARTCFNKSVEKAPTPWALRCLAILKQTAGDDEAAADLMAQAIEMLPQRQLGIEALRALIRAGRYEDIERAAQKLPAAIRALGRIKALRIEAFLERNMINSAEKLLLSGIELTDVKEGEVSLTDMWFKLCAMKISKSEKIPLSDELIERAKSECPPPADLDFRMK
jgi:tetratricopeptide (TPR) repeat protein